MQAIELRPHLAICSFFNRPRSTRPILLFGYFGCKVGGKSKSVAPLEERKKEGEVYELTAPGMMILRRPKRYASREIAPGPNRRIAIATAIVLTFRQLKEETHAGCHSQTAMPASAETPATSGVRKPSTREVPATRASTPMANPSKCT